MRQYEMFELTLKGPVQSEAWASVDVKAEFTLNGKTTAVKGFYDGTEGNRGIYKVRFLPESAGTCRYTVSGLVQAEGCEEVTETSAVPDENGAEGSGAVRSHGLVRAVGEHLYCEDGTRFDSFGTTIYGFAHQSDDVTADSYNSLAHAPFNKLRMCVFPKHYFYNHNEPKYYPFAPVPGHAYVPMDTEAFGAAADSEARWNVQQPDPKFWHNLEAHIQRLGSMGIQVDLILFHPYDRWNFSNMGRENDLIYLDYAIRRLAAFPNIWWSMANEYDLFRHKTMEDWHAIENCLAAEDPYHHMLGNHNCFAMYDASRKNITHVSLQSRSTCRVPELRKQYGKPVLYDECCYEGNLRETFGSITGEVMTQRFWEVMTSGGYCTHGETFIDYDMDNIDEAVVFWAKGGKLIGKSPERIAFLRQIVSELPGPIDPVEMPMNRLFTLPEEDAAETAASMPGRMRFFGEAKLRMGLRERMYHGIPEVVYAGHAGDEAYLYYYGQDVHGLVTLDLPADHTYRIEIVDTWNMTRQTAMSGASGHVDVRMPEKQWMAVLARKEK